MVFSDSFENEDPVPGRAYQVGPETRTTAFSGRSCNQCGRPLTGRKQRFCSDRCRMQDRRAKENRRRSDLLNRLRQAVSELERELTGTNSQTY